MSMKKILNLITMASMMVGMVACDLDKGLQTEFCKKYQSFVLEEGRKEHLEVQVEVEYVTGGVRKELKEEINRVVVEAAFGNQYEALTVEEAAGQFVSDACENYKEANEDFLEEMKKTSAEGGELEELSYAAFNWMTKVEASFLPPYQHYLSYLVESYTYEGGAHGMSSKIPVVIDRQTGKVVSEEDLFVPDYQAQLARLLTSCLHDSFENEEDYECLFTKDIKPNGSFYLIPEGVVYVYGAYDIGPYYLGNIEVKVPWEELEDILK